MLDAELAIQPDAPKVKPDGNLFDGEPNKSTRGNMEEGFEQADVIVEGVFTTPAQIHMSRAGHVWRAALAIVGHCG